ncbi:cytochrome p450 [Venturia nashicola]|nr:cytochrome p450 [Venturia nashicola]
MIEQIFSNLSAGFVIAGAIFLYGIFSGYSYYIERFQSPLKDIPGPFYGPLTNLHLVYYFATGEIWKYVEKMHQLHGDMIRLGPRHIWVSDITAVKQCLSTIDLPKVKMYSEISRDRNAPGLFGEIRREPHKQLKRFLAPAFTTKYIDGLGYLFEECVGTMIEVYERSFAADKRPREDQSLETDLMEDLHNVALDIMGECSFGQSFGQTDPERAPPKGMDEKIWRSVPRSIFQNQSNKYGTVFIKRFLRKFGIEWQFDWSQDMIKGIDTTIKNRTQDMESGRPDLLQHVIQEGLRPDTGNKWTTREIIDQMAEILLAGAETTSGTLGCLFLQIARNPDVKQKLFDSLPVLAANGPVISAKAIRDDPTYAYLNAVIKECLRLNPIASELGRRTGTQWQKIGGVDLPPHTVVSVSYRKLHLDERYWPEPERFWPERWLEDGQRDGAPKACMEAYFPFSAGKHSCIGINFANAELAVVSANMLSRYDVEEVPGQVVDWRQFITLCFKDGKWRVKLKPRVH